MNRIPKLKWFNEVTLRSGKPVTILLLVQRLSGYKETTAIHYAYLVSKQDAK